MSATDQPWLPIGTAPSKANIEEHHHNSLPDLKPLGYFNGYVARNVSRGPIIRCADRNERVIASIFWMAANSVEGVCVCKLLVLKGIGSVPECTGCQFPALP
jgi:hypothetical protein